MNSIIKIGIGAIFFLTAPTSSAQTISTSSRSGEIGWSPPESTTSPHEEQLIHTHADSIKGSRFLYDELMTGTVHYDGLTKSIDLFLRLNIYRDAFEYLKNDSIYTFAAPNRIDRVLLGGEVFAYVDKNSHSDLSGFVKMWSPRFPTIVTKMRAGLVGSASARERPYNFAIPPRFKRAADQHYLMLSEEEAVRITSIEQLIQLLSYYSPELEKFAKKEKLSAARGADLAWLLEYHQTIETQSPDNLSPNF